MSSGAGEEAAPEIDFARPTPGALGSERALHRPTVLPATTGKKQGATLVDGTTLYWDETQAMNVNTLHACTGAAAAGDDTTLALNELLVIGFAHTGTKLLWTNDVGIIRKSDMSALTDFIKLGATLNHAAGVATDGTYVLFHGASANPAENGVYLATLAAGDREAHREDRRVSERVRGRHCHVLRIAQWLLGRQGRRRRGGRHDRPPRAQLQVSRTRTDAFRASLPRRVHPRSAVWRGWREAVMDR